MRPRTGALYLAALALVGACAGGGDDVTPTTVGRTSLAPAATASISTVPASTTTAGSTTTTSPVTTAPATTPTAPAPSTTLDTSALPSCTEQPTAPVCRSVTVPLPPDADVILARYREFAAKYLEVASSPDSPDWSGMLAYVRADLRSAARAEIEERFQRGEALNVSLGVALGPVIDQSQYPEGQARLLDCRADGSYWADRVTGQPVQGERAEVRRRPVLVAMERIQGVWLMTAYNYGTGNC